MIYKLDTLHYLENQVSAWMKLYKYSILLESWILMVDEIYTPISKVPGIDSAVWKWFCRGDALWLDVLQVAVGCCGGGVRWCWYWCPSVCVPCAQRDELLRQHDNSGAFHHHLASILPHPSWRYSGHSSEDTWENGSWGFPSINKNVF